MHLLVWNTILENKNSMNFEILVLNRKKRNVNRKKEEQIEARFYLAGTKGKNSTNKRCTEQLCI